MDTALTTLQHIPGVLMEKLPPSVQTTINTPLTRRLLTFIVAWNILKQFNKILSGFVLNNWTSDTYDWPRELVLLTGGCSGIGKHVAEDLVGRGIKVVIVDIVEPQSPLAPNMFYYKGDVTSPESIKAVAAQIRKTHGDPTVLINNAGIGTEGIILEKAEATIRKIFEVNTIAHFWTVREFLPSMLERNHGHVVTVASAASFVSCGEMVDYACTKASALAFHEGLAQEIRLWHGAKKVRTSIIHPIWVKTALIKPITDSGVRFNQPILEIDQVSRRIVKHVLSGNSGQVIIPSRVSFFSLFRALPNWLQEYIRGVGSKDLKRIRDYEMAKDTARTKA